MNGSQRRDSIAMIKVIAAPSLVIAALFASHCWAHPISASESSARCNEVQLTDFSSVPDAITKVTRANWIAGVGATRGYCEVSGHVAPNVGFVIWLPGDGW